MLNEKAVRLENASRQKSTAGKVRIESWDANERMKRALKFSAMTFGAALVLVPVPIVHLLLVPILVLATPFVGWFFYNQKDVVKDGTGICPECGKEMMIAKSPNRFPMDDLCNQCKRPVQIYLS